MRYCDACWSEQDRLLIDAVVCFGAEVLLEAGFDADEGGEILESAARAWGISDPGKKLRRALEIAEMCSAGVRGPFLFVDSRDTP